jgi:hypothetical protein
MPEHNVWFVMLTLDPVTERGFLEDTSLRVSFTGMARMRWGYVRDDGISRLDAARAVRDGLPPDEQERARTAKVGRITAIEEVLL